MTRAEYEGFLSTCREQGIIDFPSREEFQTGGIVGSVEIVECVNNSSSLWFVGPYGFVLKNAQNTLFKPMKGRLGFFDVGGVA